jgi:hypothetical protein
MTQQPPITAGPPPPRRPVLRSPLRRGVLAGLLVLVLAGIVVSVLVLDHLVGSLHRGTAIAQSGTDADLTDCRDLYPEWIDTWVEKTSTDIRLQYGDDEKAVVIPWSTPDGFPAAAFAWADAVPDCGSTMLVESTGEIWTNRLDIATIDKAQFTAISTSLSALGYLLTDDQVPHDTLSIAGEQPDATGTEGDDQSEDQSGDQPGDAEGVSWFRQFTSASGTVALTFFPDDAGAPNPSGELVIAYYQPVG